MRSRALPVMLLAGSGTSLSRGLLSVPRLKRGGFVKILRVHAGRRADLPQVGQAACLAGFGAGLGEHGEQDGGEDRDDGDDDEQFDQGEPLTQTVVQDNFSFTFFFISVSPSVWTTIGGSDKGT